ncbi:hypothetical protein D3C73_1563020 [compost metagenome]
MAQLHKPFNGLCISKVPVYPHIIFGIVFMIGCRFEDWRKINRINAKLAEIIEMVNDAL